MLAFRQAFQTTFEKDELYERLGTVPTIVVDSLLSRFGEMARGSTRYFQCYADFKIIYLFCAKLSADIRDENKSSHSHIRLMSKVGRLCFKHSAHRPRLEYAGLRVSLLNCYLLILSDSL